MKPKELTVRGLILGALITTIFTAANVYLGLKVGLTFASSIPAAVISMAILSTVKDSSILENNIVQTVASAAGTLSAIIFVLPGLVIVGWWTGFPFWQSFLICLSGGMLGVMFTIPLRRALVTNSDLPYPEGVAAAEVLKVGSGTRGETKDESGEAREGLIAVHPRLCRLGGTRDFNRDAYCRRLCHGLLPSRRQASSGYNVAWSLALVGAGHLVGLSVGMAMLTGLVIAWAIAVPILTSMQPAAPAWRSPRTRSAIWRTQVRYIGAGAIAVAAIYTLARLAKPVVGGLISTLGSSRAVNVRTTWTAIFARVDPRAHHRVSIDLRLAGVYIRALDRARASAFNLTLIAIPFVLVGGFLIAANLRLHGWTHRRVKQPDFGRRHSIDRAVRVDTHPGRIANGSDATRPHRICALHHGNSLRLRDDFERQLARFENWPACRRFADASADRTHRRRGRRRVCDPFGA